MKTDNQELVKAGEIILLEKKDLKKEWRTGSRINAASMKSLKESAINILREIKGDVITHKTEKCNREKAHSDDKWEFLEIKNTVTQIFFLIQNKSLTIKSKKFPRK